MKTSFSIEYFKFELLNYYLYINIRYNITQNHCKHLLSLSVSFLLCPWVFRHNNCLLKKHLIIFWDWWLLIPLSFGLQKLFWSCSIILTISSNSFNPTYYWSWQLKWFDLMNIIFFLFIIIFRWFRKWFRNIRAFLTAITIIIFLTVYLCNCFAILIIFDLLQEFLAGDFFFEMRYDVFKLSHWIRELAVLLH